MFRRGQRLLGRRNQGKVRRIFYYLRNRAPTRQLPHLGSIVRGGCTLILA